MRINRCEVPSTVANGRYRGFHFWVCACVCVCINNPEPSECLTWASRHPLLPMQPLVEHPRVWNLGKSRV